MTQTLMADFGQDTITVRTLSESNSVTYRLVACSATSTSNPLTSYVYLNDVPYGSQTHSVGINIRVFNDANNIVDMKSFVTTATDSTMNNGFVDYMSNLASYPLVLITTFGNTRSSPVIDNWFKSVSSLNWPGAYLFNNYNYAYCGIYSSALKKIVSEVYYGDDRDGSGKGRAKLEVVYDTPSDIGTVGFPYKPITDPTEYSSSNVYEFRRYPVNDQLISPTVTYGIQPGATYSLFSELYASQALFDNGMSTRVNIRWYNGSTLVGSDSIDVPVTNPDQWYKARIELTVPANTNGFTVVAARYPRNDGVTALGGIRNVSLTQVSKGKSAKLAALGVNGVTSNNIIDGTSRPDLLTEIFDSTKIVYNPISLVGIKELPLDY